jgi:hypothetical protein
MTWGHLQGSRVSIFFIEVPKALKKVCMYSSFFLDQIVNSALQPLH